MSTHTFVSDPHGEYQTFSRILSQTTGHLHMVGDVFDRGPRPDLIMDSLGALNPDSFDIQWGNHDILWMGAAAGQDGCIANVVRICARYANLDVLEDIYGMDLGPLYDFASTAYQSDPCAGFGLKGGKDRDPQTIRSCEQVQKAMAIIQFKVEAALIAQNPGFGLDDRNLLGAIDPGTFTITLDEVTYPLTDTVFPTVDWQDPYALTPEEAQVVAYLHQQFTQCARLQEHMRVFLDNGSLYKKEGDLLLFHACVPLNPDGSLKETELFGQRLKGRALFDAVDAYVRDAFLQTDPAARKRGLDLVWYLWLGPGSPLFAKSKMATFELYLIADKAARKEIKNPFYTLLDKTEGRSALDEVFQDFGMDPQRSRIICGHTPVKLKDGESAIKAQGRVIIVDVGMSAAYQSTTGAGGMVLTMTQPDSTPQAPGQPQSSLTLSILEPSQDNASKNAAGSNANTFEALRLQRTIQVPAL